MAMQASSPLSTKIGTGDITIVVMVVVPPIIEPIGSNPDIPKLFSAFPAGSVASYFFESSDD